MQTQKLDKGEFQVYDRQLRLWGFEAQARMKESKVLIIGLSNCATELARHLVLSGINIELLTFSKSEVGPTDYERDFLFEPTDAGKTKGDVVVAKLSEMNPFAKIGYSTCNFADLNT